MTSAAARGASKSDRQRLDLLVELHRHVGVRGPVPRAGAARCPQITPTRAPPIRTSKPQHELCRRSAGRRAGRRWGRTAGPRSRCRTGTRRRSSRAPSPRPRAPGSPPGLAPPRCLIPRLPGGSRGWAPCRRGGRRRRPARAAARDPARADAAGSGSSSPPSRSSEERALGGRCRRSPARASGLPARFAAPRPAEAAAGTARRS